MSSMKNNISKKGMRLEGERTNRSSVGTSSDFRFFSSKGQISMEFITFLGVILLLFAFASYAAITSTLNIISENEITDARRIATTIAQEVNIAVEVGTGYTHSFYLPEYLYGGLSYTVNSSQSRFVYIQWKDRSYYLPVLADNVTDTVKKGQNTIKNVGGVIVFE